MENCTLETVKIADIIIGERIRKLFDEEYLNHLAENIAEDGLDDPVSLVRKSDGLHLMDGECRIRAFAILGRDEIPALIKDAVASPVKVEINRNNMQKDFSVIEKYNTYEMLREEYANEIKERRGRPSKKQVVDSVENKKSVNSHSFSPLPGEKTQEYLSRRAGFENVNQCRAVIKVMLSDCKDEIKDAMDRGTISVFRASVIASAPLKTQITLLNEAVRDPDTLTTQLNAGNKSRRAAKRKSKTKTPVTHKPHPIFRVIRIAPDWDNLVQSDIMELPVLDYAHPQLSVCIVEAPARHIPAALECLAAWDYDYSSIITIYNGKRVAEHLPYTTGDTAHLVIGTRRETGGDPSVIPEFGNLNKLPPVIERRSMHLCESLLPLIGDLFPDRKADRRIDMTSTEPVKNFVVWKLTYGDPDATIPDDNTYHATDNQESPDQEMYGQVSNLPQPPSDIEPDEITFEPDDAQPVISGDDLKVFGDD